MRHLRYRFIPRQTKIVAMDLKPQVFSVEKTCKLVSTTETTTKPRDYFEVKTAVTGFQGSKFHHRISSRIPYKNQEPVLL